MLTVIDSFHAQVTQSLVLQLSIMETLLGCSPTPETFGWGVQAAVVDLQVARECK